MARLMVLLVVALIFFYLVVELIQRVRRKIGDELGTSPAASRSNHSRAGRSHRELVACAACGIHVSKSRALPARGETDLAWYCSETCRQRLATAS